MKARAKKLAALMLTGALVLSGFAQVNVVNAEETGGVQTENLTDNAAQNKDDAESGEDYVEGSTEDNLITEESAENRTTDNLTNPVGKNKEVTGNEGIANDAQEVGAAGNENEAGLEADATALSSVMSLSEEAVVVVDKEGTESKYSNLKDAFDNAKRGSTVKLQENIVLDKGVKTAKGHQDITLDLNGYSIDGSAVTTGDGVVCMKPGYGWKPVEGFENKMSIINSRPEQGGEIKGTLPLTIASGDSTYKIAGEIGEGVKLVTLDEKADAVSLSSAYLVYSDATKDLIKNGGFKAKDQNDVECIYGDYTSAMSNATDKTVTLLHNYEGNEQIYSGSEDGILDLGQNTYTYTSTGSIIDINYPNVTLTIRNGKVMATDTSCDGAQLVGAPNVDQMNNRGLVLEGVELTVPGEAYGIVTNGTETGNKITLKDSVLNTKEGLAIYFPSSGEVVIDNSVINAKLAGVQMCAGKLTVKGEETAITVTGQPQEKTEGDGAISDGSAISVVKRDGYKPIENIAIEAGTFVSADGVEALRAYTFSNGTSSDWTEAKEHVDVAGGTFKSGDEVCDVSEYLAEGVFQSGSGQVVKNEDAAVKIGETPYATLEEAIAGAKENDIITILRDGTYKPFAIDRKQHNGLVVKAADGVKVTFEVNKEQQFTLKDGYAKETAGISFENIDFVSTDGTTILYSNYFGKDGHSFNVSNCTFTNKSEITEENTPIAIYVDFPNLTIENCTFNNWTTAYFTAGEGYVIGDMKISNNTLNDVHCLVNGYWANPASADSKFVIENNTVNNSDSEEAVVVLWDYTQYLHWLNDPYFGPDHGEKSAFVNPKGNGVVTVKGNSNTVVSAVHCNWYADSVLDNVDAEIIYSNLIEVDEDIESVEVYDAETNELVAEMKINDATGKKYIYTLAEGEYTVHVKAKDSDLISMPLVVEEPNVGEPANKIALTEENKYVASIGDNKYTSIQEAIKNIKSGDTLELLNDIVVDKGLYFVSSDTNKLANITIKGNGHTVKASDAFQTNEYGQNNLMKFEGIEGVTLEDITLVSSSASKHTLDTHKSTVTLKNVTLDHANAESGAPLINNASDITVEGELNLLTGDSSWYGINVDNKNGAASLTFAEGASLTHTMSKEVVTILKEETEGQPPVVIEGTENVGLLEKEDGSYVVHTHTLTVVEEVPATCTEDGMKKYYECSECKKYFADEAGDVEITDLESLVIPANGHQYDDRGKCTVCGVLTPDAEAANKVDALIDAIGSPDKVTLDSKAAIEAAVNAYNKLTDAQKKLVTGYEDLDKAVKVYNALLEAEEGKDPEKDPDKDKPIDKPDKGSDSEDKKPGAVQTGDTTNVAGYMAVMVLAAGIAVFAVIRRKRRG